MILILFGLPGSGKTFFARILAKELNADYLNTDQARMDLGKQGIYDEQTKKEIYEYLLKQLTSGYSPGRIIIIDGTFHKQAARELYKERAAQLNEPIYFIRMQASEGTIRRRLQSEREVSEADYKVYQQIKYSFEKMKDPSLELYSDAQTVDEMLELTKEYIDGKI